MNGCCCSKLEYSYVLVCTTMLYTVLYTDTASPLHFLYMYIHAQPQRPTLCTGGVLNTVVHGWCP